MNREFMAITKALADENRVRILSALQAGELCVCQVIEVLGLAPSTVSKHLTILKQAQLIASRKNGRWMYYRLSDGEAPQFATRAIRWVRDSLAKDKQFDEDKRRLKSILKLDPEVLCCERREGEGKKKPQALKSRRIRH